jgi:hypothetical protein
MMKVGAGSSGGMNQTPYTLVTVADDDILATVGALKDLAPLPVGKGDFGDVLVHGHDISSRCFPTRVSLPLRPRLLYDVRYYAVRSRRPEKAPPEVRDRNEAKPCVVY